MRDIERQMIMSDRSQFQILFPYHWHTASRLLDGAARLTQADYTDNPGYGHGSIQDVFFHVLRTDQGWRIGLQTGRQATAMKPEAFPDLKSLQAGFESERREWQMLLEELGEEEVQREMTLTNWRGDVLVLPRWRILQHVILHGMQHHAELAQLLTAKGQGPGNIDFLFYS